jgi:hypothetical protein
VETQSQNWKKDIGAMRNALMLRGFERHKNNFQNAKLEARKKISAIVKMVRRYLGNQLFFFARRHLCQGMKLLAA